jgi:mannose-6-phosphate isomerase-like protein (cupin superfamily)
MRYNEHMKGYVHNIEAETLANDNFRKVLYTDERLQLVVMALKPLEDIGMEVHHLDQFLRIESGEGKAILDGEEQPIIDGSVVIVPAGTNHNIVNTSSEKPMKLYTLYAPPNHAPGTVHETKAEAEKDEEHYG